VVDEELELLWNGKKSAEDALNTAVKRGNDLLRRFERTAIMH
jgi:sn-glycerol 3-phosphate transport system substrate-binding protein